MNNKDKDSNKEEDNKARGVGSYLFDGKWMEKDGIKWAFFASDRGKASHNKSPSETEEVTGNNKEVIKISETKATEKIEVSSLDKVSITDLGRATGGKRYNVETSTIPSSGILEPDIILSGRYKILECYKSIKQRDFYTAKDLRLESPCIVKELKCDYSTDEEEAYYRKRFNEEAKLLANLNHPNLPRTMDYFIENGRYFMVIDYIKGTDLENYFEQSYGQIAEEQILLWGIDICDVLEYLHCQVPPVIHRDINPSNLFIRERDRSVLLFNFSFAISMDRVRTKKIGLSGYVAPEQIAGAAEPRSDIYSLGATLHYLLSGEPPKMDGNFNPVTSVGFTASIYTDMIIKTALKAKTRDRFSSAGEMKEALQKTYEEIIKPEEKVKTSSLYEKLKKPGESEKTSDKIDRFEELAEIIQKKDKGRLPAIKELGKTGDKRALNILIPLLQEDSPSIRLSAINALSNLNDKKAIPHLAKLLEDENMELRQKVIEAIEHITEKKLPPLMVVPKDNL